MSHHECSDAAAVLTYNDATLTVNNCTSDALLIEWHAGPPPSCTIIDLATGRAELVDKPLALAVITQTLREANACFLPSKVLETARGMTHKQMLSFLDSHPDVRRKHPSKYRLYIHSPGFAACPVSSESEPSDDAVDFWLMNSPNANAVLDRWDQRRKDRQSEELRRKVGG
jgi:hypothetical protein